MSSEIDCALVLESRTVLSAPLYQKPQDLFLYIELCVALLKLFPGDWILSSYAP